MHCLRNDTVESPYIGTLAQSPLSGCLVEQQSRSKPGRLDQCGHQSSTAGNSTDEDENLKFTNQKKFSITQGKL